MNLFRHVVTTLTVLLAVQTSLAAADSLRDEVSAVYDDKLKDLFLYFHQNPELSTMEYKTSARLADELEALGYDVHRNVGGTGIVALLENGDGPLVMFRADMDGLPVEENPDCPTRRVPSKSTRMVMKCLSCTLAVMMCTSRVWWGRPSLWSRSGTSGRAR